MEKRTCLRCGKKYTPTTKWQKFCTDNCRQRAFQDQRRQEEEAKEREAEQAQVTKG